VLNRWIGFGCVFLMLVGNATLFVRDVLPGLVVGEPPDPWCMLPADEERCAQVGIFDSANRLVGRSWTLARAQGEFVKVESVTRLYPIQLPEELVTPHLRIDVDMLYRSADALVDELVMVIRGLPAVVELRGELITLEEFACKWRVGVPGSGPSGRLVLDAQATRALGQVLRPFSRLPGLRVGQTWRLELLDPLAHVIQGFKSPEILAEPQIVRVSGVETITHRGRKVEAFVVETRQTRAWVAPDGTVLRQEVELPLLGKLLLRDEPFDRLAYEEGRRWSGSP